MTYYLQQSTWMNSRSIPEGMNLDMLNMPDRLNHILKPAIDRGSKYRTWIDLGCGTGVLGLYALEKGADFVYFVEQDPQMLHILSEILPKKLLPNQYQIIAKDIESLTIDLFQGPKPEAAVSEFYGPRLFDEGYPNYVTHLKTLWPNLEFAPDAFRADFYLCDIDYDQPIWPNDPNLYDHFLYMYQHKGWARWIDWPHNREYIGKIRFDTRQKSWRPYLNFDYYSQDKKMLVAALIAEYQELEHDYTRMGWIMTPEESGARFQILIDPLNYFNPTKCRLETKARSAKR